MCDGLEAGIADGTFIKSELNEIKASNPQSMADVKDELSALEKQIDSVSEEIDNYYNCDHCCHKGGIQVSSGKSYFSSQKSLE